MAVVDVWNALKKIDVSQALDPNNLADGARQSVTVTVANAALGDFVVAAFSLDTQGIEVAPRVSAAGTVTVDLINRTGGAINLAAGTLYVRVYKR